MIDTGIFDDNRYFDVAIEYAKASPDDILIRLRVDNRGPDDGDAAYAADGMVPKYVVMGTNRRRLLAEAARCRARAIRGIAMRARVARHVRLRGADEAGPADLHRERDEYGEALRTPNDRPTLRMLSIARDHGDETR